MAKLLLEIKDLVKSCGDRELFRIEHLSVYDGERIGLIGENGAGKSTLLAILAGEAEPDSGAVRRLAPAALIRQQGGAEAAEDPQCRALFQAPEQREGLSGGELTRRRIAAALSRHPQLLMADEPTTDLDEEGLRMLTRQLEAFRGALLLVSHDRAMLRRLCSRIWCLEEGGITDFPGGYDAFRAQQQRERDRAQFEYEQYQGEQKRLRQAAQRMAERASAVRKAPARMGNSEARLHTREWTDSVLQISHAKRTIQNRMEQMEVKEKPRSLPEIRMQLGVDSPVRARTALSVTCDGLWAAGTRLLETTGFTLPAGSRTALTGPNGCGKTTLLSVLTGRPSPETAFSGKVRFNPAARPGWFDQHHRRTLREEATVLENVMAESVKPESLARTVLACLGFAREDVFKPVAVLSGGERAKTALARLLLMDCNLLILDEPTNHLDLYAMEALEELLCGYGGTLLFVSHDAAFTEKVATRSVRFEAGRLVTFEGTAGERRQAEQTADAAREREIAVTGLEIRMAELAARMASPRKGDSPEQLKEAYFRLAAELQELKRG
ncbi:MAG: ABC-F family ATP-binding cassette domain-containing protein [Clostridia bacterium]|nr:ABC-F family ATP-binding cassette domain-containing protein [Clostridia bacterium]